jgi:hypothetical protein
MRSIITGLLAAASLAVLVSAPASAQVFVPLVPHGGWTEFQFQGVGSPLQDTSSNPLIFYFTITRPKTLTVTDGWNDGDQFDIFINGIDQGPTSTPKLDFTDVGNCYSCAIGKFAASFSHASYLLAAGTYFVQGFTVQSPYFSGTGAVALGSVPEPSTWAMLISGFGLLGLAARRRRAALTA